MVKMKGWRKIIDNNIVKMWKHTYPNGDTITVSVFNDNIVWIERHEAGRMNLGVTILKRYFKTKSQAVRFATNWMKAHPNG